MSETTETTVSETTESTTSSETNTTVTTSSKGQTQEEIAAEVAKRKAQLQALIDAKNPPAKTKKGKKVDGDGEKEHKFWNTQVGGGCIGNITIY